MHRTLTTRYEVLETLLEEPRTKPELATETAVSRSTVDRAVSELLETGCIERIDAGSTYRVTGCGALAYDAHESYLADLETITEAAPILETLEPGALDLRLLRGASVDRPDPDAPWRAFERSATLVYEARSLTGTAPAVFSQFFDDIGDSVDNGGLTCELVVDATLFDSFGDDERERLRAILETGGGSLYVTDIEDSFAIWIAGGGKRDHAGVTVYGEGGPVGVIRNTSPEAVRWAEDAYAARRADADLVWGFD
ncbi:helix-turn-helix transcriptional regulator [Natronobiforma cellulositropha]|uniref:helix-turn-helix transcriptional regulator n=1 Tax=Natronobiforma cellulositropha TaxID=1679076 RepID=UPI0021D57FA5|nr:HTH domain-containing protein [Natronobiforma cellulositropha]